MSIYILGISAFYHDSAAALIRDGELVAAAQEERFSRKKGDSRFPAGAIEYCLAEAGIDNSQLDAVAYYDKPVQTFARLMQTYLEYPFQCWKSFKTSLPVLINEKLRITKIIDKQLPGFSGEIMFSRHHESHAASAFFASPFESAAIVVVDGVGEWACTSIGEGRGNSIQLMKEVRFPHSLGLFYSAITQYLGFKVNFDEYKVMGLAPYGEPRYADLILENMLDLKRDGSLVLNLDYFAYTYGLRMITKKMDEFFGRPARDPETGLEQFHMDVAASAQKVTEETMLRLARHAKEITGLSNLCLAGGSALNCVANGAIYREHIYDDIFIQPAAGDAGGALGAAWQVWYQVMGNPRDVSGGEKMRGSRWGPGIDTGAARSYLESAGADFVEIEDDQLAEKIAGWIARGHVVGLCRGRMEFGPRALGARSILGDPRDPDTQSRINLKVKYRESFRPFAPAVLEGHAGEYFDLDIPSPYMLLVMPVIEEQRMGHEENARRQGVSKLYVQRSAVPAVTHVDYSVRVQTTTAERNGMFHEIISEFHRMTGCPLIVNTSFNVRGEPIVCDHEDAYRCFLMTNIDILVVENFVVAKPGVDLGAAPAQPDK
ncbi:MAG TPA: carbamoyltransferase [bacterium]|nr:carbamoyltransferase [bacterium]